MNAKLEQAIAAVRQLSEQDQELIAGEWLNDIAEAHQSRLTDEQRAIVRDRLSQPLKTVDPARVDNILSRYTPKV